MDYSYLMKSGYCMFRLIYCYNYKLQLHRKQHLAATVTFIFLGHVRSLAVVSECFPRNIFRYSVQYKLFCSELLGF